MGFTLPSGVVNNSSAFFYAGATNKLGPLVKEPTDQILVIVDYSKLSPPVTITGASFTADVQSNPELVVSYQQINSTQTVLSFLLSGGIVGQQYNLSITTQSRTDILTVNIPAYGDCSCVKINPVPEQYNQLPLGTQAFVNTGTRYFWGTAPPSNPGVMDQWWNPTTQTLYEWVTDGGSFFWETIASAGVVTDAPIDSILYARYNGAWVEEPIQADVQTVQFWCRQPGAWALHPIQSDAPSNNQSYVRRNGAWAVAPTAVIIVDAPSDGTLYGRENGAWVRTPTPAIVNDAPSDGNSYVRSNGGWVSGGIFTGSVTVRQALNVNGSVSVGGNLAITGTTTFGAQVALPYDPISALQAATKQYVDNNYLPVVTAIQNFLMKSGGTMTGSLVLYADPTAPMMASTKEYVDGRTPITMDAPQDGQVYCRSMDGWVVSPSGGMSDAPINAFVYLRGQQTWNSGGTLNGSLTINGVTTLGADPIAPAQAATKNYVDTTRPAAASANPLMDGVASPGSGTQYSLGNHVHPTDTSRYAASNPAGYTTLAAATAAAPVQSVAGRTGAVTLTHNDITDWATQLSAYAPLVSPAFGGTPTAPVANPGTSTSQIATTSFVTNGIGVLAAAVAVTFGSYLLLSGGTLTGPLILAADPTTALGAATKQYVDTPTNMTIDCGTF